MTEFLNVLLEDVHLVSDEFRKSLKSLVLAEGGIQYVSCSYIQTKLTFP